MTTNIAFVILCFEGPDPYSRAGGLGSRVTELSSSLAELGFETHLFFIGDPRLPGYEAVPGGRLILHRWCQWISEHHPAGVYDGEEGKLYDWNRSLPPWVESNILAPAIPAGGQVAILAEEWHTADTILALRGILERRGWGKQVRLLWNANNTFSFHRIDWQRLKQASIITTVSRYMKNIMLRYGVDARVIPNGIAESWLQPLNRRDIQRLSHVLEGRLTLVKVARWDPDKQWEMAVDAIAEMKGMGLKPLFIARGGLEPYGHQIVERARQYGLRLAFVQWTGSNLESLAQAIHREIEADMIVLQTYMSQEQRRTLFHIADAVLANSASEPFGLVGLETMAVGGIAFVGSTGEDYITPGYDSMALYTPDPHEIVHHVLSLRHAPEVTSLMRRAARRSATRYAWPSVIRRSLLPTLEELGLRLGSPLPRITGEE